MRQDYNHLDCLKECRAFPSLHGLLAPSSHPAVAPGGVTAPKEILPMTPTCLRHRQPTTARAVPRFYSRKTMAKVFLALPLEISSLISK